VDENLEKEVQGNQEEQTEQPGRKSDDAQGWGKKKVLKKKLGGERRRPAGRSNLGMPSKNLPSKKKKHTAKPGCKLKRGRLGLGKKRERVTDEKRKKVGAVRSILKRGNRVSKTFHNKTGWLKGKEEPGGTGSLGNRKKDVRNQKS